MVAGKTFSQRLREQAGKAKKDEVASAMKAGFVQKTHTDIPTFPYGYYVKDTNTTGRVASKWVQNPFDFTYDSLSSFPSIEELKNMYGQLDEYTSSLSPHLLESSRVRRINENFSYDGTPVTPMHLDGKKHLYHILRIRLDGGRFIEFLRQNSTGYVLAFRMLDNLDDLLTPYWCYFCDIVGFVEDLIGIFKFKRTHYQASYVYPWKVRFGRDSINNGADLLSLVYEQYRNAPDDHGAADGDGDLDAAGQAHDILDDDRAYLNSSRDPATVLAFHFFFALLGECPRSDPYKDKMYETITSTYEENCEPVGLRFEGLAKNWNSSCKTALLLKLVIELLKFAPALKDKLPDMYAELKNEFISYDQLVQLRCRNLVENTMNIQEILCLTKERVHKVVKGKVVHCYVYRNRAYNRIVDYCLSMVLYSELVLGVMLRHKGYKKPVYLEEFEVKDQDCSSRAMDAEALFIAQYKIFEIEYKEGKRRLALLLGFLDNAVVFLKRWCYSTLVIPALDLEDVEKWCEMFKLKKESMTEVGAAKCVMRAWIESNNAKNNAIEDVEKRIDLNAAVKALVDFIGENCPQYGSDID